MSPSRHIVRSNRRKLIHSGIGNKDDVHEVTELIKTMPAELRSTCVLDIEEYLIEKNLELVAQNPWWSNINLNKLWESLRRNGLA